MKRLSIILILCLILAPVSLAEGGSPANDFFAGLSQAWNGLVGMTSQAGQAVSDWAEESGLVEWAEGAAADISAWANDAGIVEWAEGTAAELQAFIDENGPSVRAWLDSAGDEVRQAWDTLVNADQHTKQEVQEAYTTVVESLSSADAEAQALPDRGSAAGLADPLSLWTPGAQAKGELTAYLAAITDAGGDSYIPVEDRIAVFDLDGTLMCETFPRCFEYMVFVDYALNNPDYTPTDEIRAVAREIIDTRWGEKPSGISTRQAAAAAIAYAGMTPAELEAYVKGFMASDAEGFVGLKRGEAFYRPMLEVVDLLKANDFTIYIVTATERNIVRALVGDALGIRPGFVIGTEYGYTATGQGDVGDGDYTFRATDKVVFDGNYYGENAKMSKVDAIVREIGQQPVLAFGNSSGDTAMCAYVVANNPHPARAYMVIADDEEREWGDAEGARSKIDGYAELGIGVISMRDDFVTIYGDGVLKDAGAAES